MIIYGTDFAWKTKKKEKKLNYTLIQSSSTFFMGSAIRNKYFMYKKTAIETRIAGYCASNTKCSSHGFRELGLESCFIF